jgi:hypothetical protein
MRARIWNQKRSVSMCKDIFTPLMATTNPKKIKQRSEEALPQKLAADGWLVKDRAGGRWRYYYVLPQVVAPRSDNQAPPAAAIAAVDPGVRTFATNYLRSCFQLGGRVG